MSSRYRTCPATKKARRPQPVGLNCACHRSRRGVDGEATALRRDGARGRFGGRTNHTVRLRDDVVLRHAIVHAAGDGSAIVAAAISAATTASAARVVSVAVARVPAIRRVAVKVAPVTLAATPAAPGTGHEQREHTTERSAVPGTPIASVAAWIGARIPARAASLAAHSATRPTVPTAAVRVAIGRNCDAPRSIGEWSNGPVHRPAGWAASLVASGDTRRAVAATKAGPVAEDCLEQTATGSGCQQSAQQTAQQEAFHDFVPHILKSHADSQQRLSSEQSEESRKSLKPKMSHWFTRLTQTSIGLPAVG